MSGSRFCTCDVDEILTDARIACSATSDKSGNALARVGVVDRAGADADCTAPGPPFASTSLRSLTRLATAPAAKAADNAAIDSTEFLRDMEVPRISGRQSGRPVPGLSAP